MVVAGGGNSFPQFAAAMKLARVMRPEPSILFFL